MEMIMKIFKSHKKVTAKPMNRITYNAYRGWELPVDENGSDDGYLVEYLDGGKPNHPDHKGYISWSPKEQFDNGHSEVKEATFIERLADEIAELDERIVKLDTFSYGENAEFAKLKLMDQTLLRNQLRAMYAVKKILDVRLERLADSSQ